MSELPRVVIVGAGRMGPGIGLAFALGRHLVEVVDLKPRSAAESAQVLAGARVGVAQDLELLVSCGLIDDVLAAECLGRVQLRPAADAPAAIGRAGLVIEAVPELRDAKVETLRQIGEMAGHEALVASTTGSFAVDEMAAWLPEPERYLNAHWLNPAHLIPVVEVIPGPRTSTAALKQFESTIAGLGKVAVRCAPSPGSIVARIQVVAMNEAARIVEERVAEPADVDRASQLGFGLRFAAMGALGFADWGGNDTLARVGDSLASSLGSERYRAPRNVGEMARDPRGWSGNGAPDRTRVTQRLVALLRTLDLLPPTLSGARVETQSIAKAGSS